MFRSRAKQNRILSRGRHRSPAAGACLMEMTSAVAGERWSDHPASTHPLLAALARMVNDHTGSDERRDRLTDLIPALVGLHSTDPTWYPRIAVAVASEAILDLPEPRQRAMAVGLLHTRGVAAALGVPLDLEVALALDQVPGAARWAQRHSVRTVTPARYCSRTAPAMVVCAVQGMASAAVPDPDVRLRELLEAGIAAAQASRMSADPIPVPTTVRPR